MSAYYPVKNPYEDQIPVIFIAGDADINDINDKCLLAIFDHLPINDLIRVSRVCTRWNTLHEAACLRRTHLSVFIGSWELSCNELTAFSELYVPSSDDIISKAGTLMPPSAAGSSQLRLYRLDNRNTFQMTRKLRRITHLELVFSKGFHSPLDQYIVGYLLGQWAPNLMNFKLRVFADNITLQNQVSLYGSNLRDHLYSAFRITPQLLQAINQLQALKHLTLECWPLWVTESDVKLTIMSKLEEFYICAPDRALLSLMRNLDVRKIRRIGVVPKISQTSDLVALLVVEPSLASRFTHIGNMGLTFLMQPSQLESLCTNFSSLTNLRIDVTNIPISQWTNCLSKLKKLTYLSLADYNFNSFSTSSAPSIVKKEDPDEPLLDQSISATANLSKLRSVKSLFLRCYLKTHMDLFAINFQWIFPNLELIQIDLSSYNCTICQIAPYNDFTWSSANLTQRAQCTQMLLHPLGKCRRTLRTIYTSQAVSTDPVTQSFDIRPIMNWNNVLENAKNFY